jgi:antitoxin (DNA-binding transcriptional repressor) of toxin-antitoxin stability system
MREFGVLEVKTRLSALLAELEATGETIAITRHGHRIARLSPEPRRTGSTDVAIQRLLRWRAEVAEESPGLREDFDWKQAVEDGRE